MRRLTGYQAVVKFRRMLGLFAFFYACLHLLTYVWLDQFFAFMDMAADIMERPFITVGFFSFLLLVPLALTSTRAMILRLGGRRWQRLHQLVYVAALGGVVHFWWLVKADIREPLIYGAVITLLLGSRALAKGRWRFLSLTGMRRPASLTSKESRDGGALKKRGALTHN